MKLHLKLVAITLRKKGFSIPDIARKLDISESTASLWCREIRLTPAQKHILEVRTNRKLGKFFAMVERQKQTREIRKKAVVKAAIKEVGKLSERELFIAGIALYWAEGFKHKAEGRLGFCNSDPAMVKFQIKFWLSCLGVKKEDISPRLTLNEAFLDRTGEIQDFWADCLGIPTSQFTKPFYQRTKLVKEYKDRGDYHGVLRIHARKSSQLLIRTRGFMEGLRGNSV